MNRRAWGFTLMELIFTVAVVAVLTAVAVPAYMEQIRKSNRAEGKSALMQAAHLQERNYTQFSTYADTAGLATLMAAGATIYSGEDPTSARGKYVITVDAATVACPLSRCFVLRAVPNASQFADPQCDQLTLASTGTRGIAGSPTLPADRCW
jgi:type IV pilus assembly protein PilE